MLGTIQWPYHNEHPTSTVYFNTNTAQFAHVVYNPKTYYQVATVYSNATAIGSILAAPGELTSESTLLPLTNQLAVIATIPKNDRPMFPARSARLSPRSAPTSRQPRLNGATISGPGVTGLTYNQGDGTRVIVFDISGTVQLGQTYTVTIRILRKYFPSQLPPFRRAPASNTIGKNGVAPATGVLPAIGPTTPPRPRWVRTTSFSISPVPSP